MSPSAYGWRCCAYARVGVQHLMPPNNPLWLLSSDSAAVLGAGISWHLFVLKILCMVLGEGVRVNTDLDVSSEEVLPKTGEPTESVAQRG